jgi:hypothetical protein
MINYFCYRERPDGKYMIAPIYKEFGEDWRIMGSWAVLPARLFGLSFPDYLRYCIMHGANVWGKNHYYPIVVWEQKNEGFLLELNRRANALIQIK